MGINSSNQSRSVFQNAAIWLMTVALIVFVVFSLVIIMIGNLPAAPVLPTVGSSAQWQRLKAEQIEQLSTYGWANQEAGVVHIPIEEAMRLQVERGLPARQGDETTN